MTSKSSRSTGMNGLKRLLFPLTVAVMVAVACHAESEWPQADAPPAVPSDQSQPVLPEDIQPSPETTVPTETPAPPIEAPAAAEPQVSVETPVETPVEVPAEAPPLPADGHTEAPIETPPATEVPAAETPPATEETPPDAIPPQFSENPIISTDPPEVQEAPQQQ